MDNVTDGLKEVLGLVIDSFAVRYQRYFAAHAISGDPNALNPDTATPWRIANDEGGEIYNVLKTSLAYLGKDPFFSVGYYRESSAENCDF